MNESETRPGFEIADQLATVAHAAAADLARARERLFAAIGSDPELFAQYRDEFYPPIGYVDRYSSDGKLIGRRRQTWWDRRSNLDRALLAIAAIAVVITGVATWLN